MISPLFIFFRESYEWSMLKIMMHTVGWQEEMKKKTAVVGCTGGKNVIRPSPRTMYELFSMVWVIFLTWFVEVELGFLFFCRCCWRVLCGLGFGGQGILLHKRGFSVLFCFSAAGRRLCIVCMHLPSVNFTGGVKYHTFTMNLYCITYGQPRIYI